MICAVQERKCRSFFDPNAEEINESDGSESRKMQFNYYKDKEKKKPSKLMAGKALTY